MTGFDDLNESLGESDPEPETDRPDESDESVGQTSLTEETDESDGFDRSTLPLKYRRETVKDERDRVDLFVLAETEGLETDTIRELDDLLGDRLSVIDAREAIYRAGMANLDDALGELRGWGYE